MRKRILLALPVLAVLALVVWGGTQAYVRATQPATETIPTTRVKRGDVAFTVTARAELQGGNSQMLTAPMMGGAELYITELRQPGELVKKDDVVVQFDTTEQTYKLREAEADLAEAEQQVAQAKSESEAKQEEDRYALLKARADLQLAELEARKNPLLGSIAARQNDLEVEQARNHLEQLERDLADRKATNAAGIAIQEAARNKAKVMADMARRNIESMTLRAQSDGYVSIQQNSNTNFFFMGMQFPLFQLGDIARPGMAVAQIPDLSNWELSARIAELDRGHVAPGQKAEVKVVALHGKQFTAHIANLGGTVGPPWDRRFECKLALENPSPDLRPGMTATIVITTDTIKKALWLPAQALFESDGRTYVYVQKQSGFVPADVKLVRRGESRVVISGVAEGQVVALASPEQQDKKKSAPGTATKAILKT